MIGPTLARGGEPCELIGVIDPAELVQRWKTDFGIDVSASFSSIDELRLLKGQQSGIVYFDPAVVGDEELYRRLSKEAWYYLDDKWELRRSLDSVRPGRKVLEVGCGRGAYLLEAKARGADVTGVELNRAAVADAQSKGLNVSAVDVYEAPAEWARAFDVVSAFQVVEHVPEPIEFCKKLYSFVKSGGELHVAVPNNGGFMGEANVVLDFPPHHMSRWNKRALEYVGTRLQVQRTEVVVGPLESMHFDVYLDVARRRFGRALFNRFTNPIVSALLGAGGRYVVAGHSLLAIYTSPLK